MIMKIFPIFSGVFAFIVPAALAWYFLVQNLFRIGQQAYITKRFYQRAPGRHRRQAGVDAEGGAELEERPRRTGQAGPEERRRNKVGRARRRNPAKAAAPKAKPTPRTVGATASDGRPRSRPPRPSGSTPKPPARPRPQQKKKP